MSLGIPNGWIFLEREMTGVISMPAGSGPWWMIRCCGTSSWMPGTRRMIQLVKAHELLLAGPAQQLYLEPNKKVLAYTRGNLIFVFCFHPSDSFEGLAIPVPSAGDYQLLLHSDAPEFGGFDRLDHALIYPTNAKQELLLYVPSRVGMVLEKKG